MLKRLIGAVAMLLLSALNPATAHAAALRDSVTCIYDAMTAEQRDAVQAILLQNMENGGNPLGDKTTTKQIEATIKDATDACVDQYAWSSGKTFGASGYAMLTLLSEALGPSFEADGVIRADIDGYIALRKAGLNLNRGLTKAMSAELFAYLTTKGWKLDSPQTKQAAEMYFRLQLGREAARRQFAQNVTYRH